MLIADTIEYGTIERLNEVQRFEGAVLDPDLKRFANKQLKHWCMYSEMPPPIGNTARQLFTACLKRLPQDRSVCEFSGSCPFLNRQIKLRDRNLESVPDYFWDDGAIDQNKKRLAGWYNHIIDDLPPELFFKLCDLRNIPLHEAPALVSELETWFWENPFTSEVNDRSVFSPESYRNFGSQAFGRIRTLLSLLNVSKPIDRSSTFILSQKVGPQILLEV